MKEEIKQYDKNKNLIYYKNSGGYERWSEYDKNNNLVHCKHSNGFEEWRKYDENNNLINCKDTDGYEFWWKYIDNKQIVIITEQEFKKIERIKEKRKLYLNIKNSNRFEIMDI